MQGNGLDVVTIPTRGMHSLILIIIQHGRDRAQMWCYLHFVGRRLSMKRRSHRRKSMSWKRKCSNTKYKPVGIGTVGGEAFNRQEEKAQCSILRLFGVYVFFFNLTNACRYIQLRLLTPYLLLHVQAVQAVNGIILVAESHS